ncbi:MAG: DUF6148 family protein [Cetobacterium sp.]|uniref:DUF6148 family protein n=1 Tax=Cetobacterium sp. TaxID=2071632 RepID=UPI003F2FCA65
MYTVELCEAKLKLWLKVEEDIAIGGQSYEVKGRKLTRVDMEEVREQIKLWEVRLSRAKGAEGIRFGKAVIW